MALNIEDISVSLDNSAITDTDMVVCNAARQSFGKQKDVNAPLTVGDKKLLHFLATGLSTADWDELHAILEAKYLSLFEARKEGYEDFAAKKHNEIQAILEAFKRTAQHWTPFAHPSIRLRIRIPVFLARQLVKHQIGGAWSEESRRYIDEEPSFYMEPILHKRPAENIKQGSGEPFVDAEHDAVMAVMRNGTEQAKDRYMRLVRDYGLSPEEAREILPLNHMTGVTWTGNLLFWARVVNQRVDPHAQHAANRLALYVDQIIKPLFPESWKVLTGR